ncbi:DNA ligase 4 isoform X2 [Odontomachus brunneus]|uniref:DNA ligase 4 isoform X2 n=1 Tax=Odontomachus brunneus TaxID=486640 RepID=UPI0013F279EE|nr:DNA ligase 4 isoform X2 [Odontomachus brunneus]
MAGNIGTLITFMQLCDIFEKVRASRSKKEKVQILQEFVMKCRNDADKMENAHEGELDEMMYPIFRLILPNLAKKKQKETQSSLARLYARINSLPKQSRDYQILVNDRNSTSDRIERNDFADRAYSVLKQLLPSRSDNITIADINSFLDNISNIDNKDETMQQKVEMFRIIFRRMTGLEMKWLTRIVLKDLQLGIKSENIQDFLKIKQDVQLFSHFKPMLLERLSIDDVHKLFSTSTEYYVQIKYDGERSQIHMSHGRYKYFTRNGYDITKKPLLGETASSGYLSDKFTHVLDPNCSSFILDGELIVWDKTKKALLTKGMNVDVKSLKANGPYRPCFVAFDIIMHNDDLLLNIPYHTRLKHLRSLLNKAHGAVTVGEATVINDKKRLENTFRSECLEGREEGIVVKRYDFLYKPNVRDGGGCYKIKAEYSNNLVQDLDLIILAGYYTKDKCKKKLNSLLMGAALPMSNEEEHPSYFEVILSVSNGLNKEEWNFLEKKFSSKCLEECPANIINCSKKHQPDVWLRPEDSIILTIRATEMVPSDKYPIGYSFRFPRVTNVRKEKPWYGVCTTQEILSLVKKEKTIHKLIKIGATLHSDEKLFESPKRTSNKPRTRALAQSEEITHIAFERKVIHTRLLEGKEICVINGTEDFSKEDIQETLKCHCAKIVEYPKSTTYCTIVGNTTTLRAFDTIKNHDNVVSFDWFLRISSDPKSSISFQPWELLSKLKNPPDPPEEYDKYFDYYHHDATALTLKHSFARINELGLDAEFSQYSREMSSSYTFRGINGFFSEKMTFEQLIFGDQEGNIKKNFDNSVTYVFVKDKTNHIASDLKMYEQAGVKIVKSEWIIECFFHDKFLSVEDYLIDLSN